MTQRGFAFRFASLWLLFPLALLLLAIPPPSIHGQSILGRVIVAGDTTGVSGAELVLTDFATLPSHRGRGLATFPPATGSSTSSESGPLQGVPGGGLEEHAKERSDSAGHTYFLTHPTCLVHIFSSTLRCLPTSLKAGGGEDSKGREGAPASD